MSKTPTDAELGAALRVILAAASYAVPPTPTTSTTASKSDAKSEPDASTPEAPKDEAGNASGLTVETFTKALLDKSKAVPGGAPKGGPILKGVLQTFGVERLGEIPAAKYDEFIAKADEAFAEAALA